MGAKGWTIATAVVAVIGFAPWAIYLAGLGKLTEVLSDKSVSQALKQTIIMLEWYTVAAQFVNLILVVILCIARKLNRSHSVLIMFIAVNTALIIVRATDRIAQINLIDDGHLPGAALGVPGTLTGKPLSYLRAEACGQVASATWNFLLAIMIGIAGTALEEAPAYQQPTVA
ncbi:hypothetical protein GPECTOR_11g53 [Gonium pectorale]|uniref:Uncharacterized protein n=1 Tax=Gonium pectorale TaxID=33097 RepID=A0A150GQ10_GONPE|nr:hypothetical protein GPECTOR_11g53 [Gonium pectorale]|eukprot:KXZ51927.1 hypothetical protein GPECTOR_11g53 [Gonium pectorale]